MGKRRNAMEPSAKRRTKSRTGISLSKTGSSFMFATHLHNVAKMERIKILSNVKPYHLTVKYDEQLDTLIFDRLLKPGFGPEMYGVTIARYIIQNKEFLKLTQEIKYDMLNMPNSIIGDKTSRYSSSLYMKKCAVCGSPGEHTHHIIYQNKFKNIKFIIISLNP